MEGEGERVEGSRGELAENRLILSQIYSTPIPLPQSKQTKRDSSLFLKIWRKSIHWSY